MKNKLKNYLLIGVFCLLAVSSVVMTIETATTGVEIGKIEKAERELSRQKMELEESLVKSLSMGKLQEKSADLGFTKPANLVYITPSETVAKLP